METKDITIVEEALQQLSFPSFFDRNERKAAYNLIMFWGDEDERSQAEAIKYKYPFDEQIESLFSPISTNDFPIVSRTNHARFGE